LITKAVQPRDTVDHVLDWAVSVLALSCVGAGLLLLPLVNTYEVASMAAGFLLFCGFVLSVVAVALPSRRHLLQKELEQRRAVEAADLARRKETFRGALDASREPTVDSIDRLLALQAELHLSDDEIGRPTAATLANLKVARAYEKEVNELGHLPVMDGPEVQGVGRPCYFAEPSFVETRGPDERGILFLTDAGFVFQGDSHIDLRWDKVSKVAVDGSSLKIHRHDRQTALAFWFDAPGAARKAAFIVTRISKGEPRGGSGE
jgi:hypothetical protein